MRRHLPRAAFAVALLTVAGFGSYALAGDGPSRFEETLVGYEETPFSLSTSGSGRFEARIEDGDDEIRWTLSYSQLEGSVTQAHIHFGQRRTSGGISVWLCSNLASPPTPAGTQACPQGRATISGTIVPADVVGPGTQGIAPGEFDELVAAIRARATYANVHSDKYPGGEIRAQLLPGRDKDD